MGEGYRGESLEFYHRHVPERDPDMEAKENLEKLWAVLAKLIEQGGDLPAQTKKLLRAQVQTLLAALNIKSLEDYDALSALQEQLFVKSRLPEPAGYPTKQDFENQLRYAYHTQGHEAVPKMSRNIHASDVAEYGQTDWSKITSKGVSSGVDYLYNLGKILACELAYTAAFDQSDVLTVGQHWNIENGRHRALTLRTLGPDYVSATGMDRWVEVAKEK